jgi:hypothetical protein
MTARKYCAATADNNLLSLPDLPCPRSRWCAAAGMPACIRSVKTWRDKFSLFHFARPALIDAILLTGIAFRQIR